MAQLLAADQENCARWKLDDEVSQWGYAMPDAAQLFDALFAQGPIEWNRIGHFQDISLRLIAASMLPTAEPLSKSGTLGLNTDQDSSSSGNKTLETFLQGELTQLKPSLPLPRGGCKFHVYCSAHNEGAKALMLEVSNHFEPAQQIVIAESIEELVSCECMLVYLTDLTWTSGERSTAFAEEIEHAMEAEMRLFLCHEMPGVGGQAERHACEFANFFSCARGTTPKSLQNRDIYSSIATPLKGGAWRDASMVMALLGLAKDNNRELELGESVVFARSKKLAALIRRRARPLPSLSSAVPDGDGFYGIAPRPSRRATTIVGALMGKSDSTPILSQRHLGRRDDAL